MTGIRYVLCGVIILSLLIGCSKQDEREEFEPGGILMQGVGKVVAVSNEQIRLQEDEFEITKETIACDKLFGVIPYLKEISLNDIKIGDTVSILFSVRPNEIKLLAIEKGDLRRGDSGEFSRFVCESLLKKKYKVIYR